MSESGEPAPVSQEDATNALTALENQLKEIKNDRGEQKYLSVEVALKALLDSQEYIGKLKGETEEEKKALLEEVERYQTELSKRESLESLIKKLAETKGQEPPPAPTQPPPPKKEEDVSEGTITAEQLQELVQKEINAQRLKEQTERNLTKSMDALASISGDVDAEVFLEEKAKEVGLSKESLVNIASTSPDAFSKLVGAKAKPTKTSITQGNGRVSIDDNQAIDTSPKTNMIYGATDSDRAEYGERLRQAAMKKLGVSS